MHQHFFHQSISPFFFPFSIFFFFFAFFAFCRSIFFVQFVAVAFRRVFVVLLKALH